MKSSFAALRKHLRVAWRLPINIRLVREKTVMKAVTCNVSSHGVMVFTQTPLEPGADVVVSIDFPGAGAGSPMNLKGSVVRQDPAIAGTQAIAFRDLQASEVRRIRAKVFGWALQLMERISEFPAFWDLTDLDLLALASVCHETTLAAGEPLAHLGDEATSLFLVKSGKVQLLAPHAGKNTDSEVDVAQSGQIFGEVSALLGLPHSLDIVALEDTTLLVIPRTAVAYLRDYNPNLAVSLYEIFAAFMGRRLRKMTGRLFAPLTY
jgi:CRP/FNR family transcriptional regulator, cyclic AMP receptor protein